MRPQNAGVVAAKVKVVELQWQETEYVELEVTMEEERRKSKKRGAISTQMDGVRHP